MCGCVRMRVCVIVTYEYVFLWGQVKPHTHTHKHIYIYIYEPNIFQVKNQIIKQNKSHHPVSRIAFLVVFVFFKFWSLFSCIGHYKDIRYEKGFKRSIIIMNKIMNIYVCTHICMCMWERERKREKKKENGKMTYFMLPFLSRTEFSSEGSKWSPLA